MFWEDKVGEEQVQQCDVTLRQSHPQQPIQTPKLIAHLKLEGVDMFPSHLD
jgi:hypothetical protein